MLVKSFSWVCRVYSGERAERTSEHSWKIVWDGKKKFFWAKGKIGKTLIESSTLLSFARIWKYFIKYSEFVLKTENCFNIKRDEMRTKFSWFSSVENEKSWEREQRETLTERKMCETLSVHSFLSYESTTSTSESLREPSTSLHSLHNKFPLVEGKFNFLFHSFATVDLTVDAIERAPTHAWWASIQIFRIRFAFSRILVLVLLAFYYFLQTIKEGNIIRFISISIVEILFMLWLVLLWKLERTTSRNLRSHERWKCENLTLSFIGFSIFSFFGSSQHLQIVFRLSTIARIFHNDEWRWREVPDQTKSSLHLIMHLCCAALVVFSCVGGACLWERRGE